MRFLSTRVHGMLDYLVGVILICAPWVLGFADNRIEAWLPVVLGAGAILYSLITDYEWGALRLLPMSVHLLLDAGSGVLLAASPWLFGFADYVWVPHLVMGLFEVGVAAVTDPASRPATAARLG